MSSSNHLNSGLVNAGKREKSERGGKPKEREKKRQVWFKKA
jgi:hypothetical protein